MNSSLEIFISAMVVLVVLGVIWGIFLINYLGRNNIKKENHKILSRIKPDLSVNGFADVCPAELPNTDDDIADALKYIKPTDFANDLLENLYEQTGV